MKNEQLSLKTKKALAASLKEAMRHKAFSKITVKEIIRSIIILKIFTLCFVGC